MNWLAHTFLSEPDIEFRLGNLLADLVKGSDLDAMPEAFLAGVRQHQAIDAFTDTHPIVRRSRARIWETGRFRHESGILVDVFYDHFLAIAWDDYADEPLDAFTARLYAAMQEVHLDLPPEAKLATERMVIDDPLGSYRTLDGIETALRRISRRLTERSGREFELERGIDELVAHLDDLRDDFGMFFPALVASTEASRVSNT